MSTSGASVSTLEGASADTSGPAPAISREFMLSAVVMLAAFAIVAMPTYIDLAKHVWSTDEQSHGPVVLAVAMWLLWSKRHVIAASPGPAAPLAGGVVLAFGFVLYVIGRSQAIIQAEVLALLLFISAGLLWLRGVKGLRLAWFPLFFLLFTIPLPGVLVQAITLPLKSAVSYVAEYLLHLAGYPVGRTGVILVVGPYQLLVADACAGLTSMFTLEAFGLLYMHVMGYTSRLRNVILGILVVPCAFIANVVRVLVLVLVTYHFGNEAGQGFVHSFAGIVLFVVAFVLLIGADAIVGRLLARRAPAAA
jgi:exosortase B